MDKNLIATGFKLFLICAVAATSLGVLNEITEPEIIKTKVEEEQEALAALVATGEVGEKVAVDEGTVRAYYPVSLGGSTDGFVLELRGTGYGGEMKIMAAYKATGEIISARLLDNNETPGLGKNAESESYMRALFVGTGGEDDPVPTSKDQLGSGASGASGEGASAEQAGLVTWLFGEQTEGGGADLITGATVTFLGVSRALAEGAEYVREKAGEN